MSDDKREIRIFPGDGMCYDLHDSRDSNINIAGTWYNRVELLALHDSAAELAVLRRVAREAAAHMAWLGDRLIHVYGENPNVDFMHATRRHIAALEDHPTSGR